MPLEIVPNEEAPVLVIAPLPIVPMFVRFPPLDILSVPAVANPAPEMFS